MLQQCTCKRVTEVRRRQDGCLAVKEKEKAATIILLLTVFSSYRLTSFREELELW